MEVQVSKISNTVPFKVDGTIDVSEFDTCMATADVECTAREPVVYSATLTRQKGGICLEANIKAKLWMDCVRCNKRDAQDIDFNTKVMLVSSADAPKADEIILGADDLDVSFYEKDTIDVDFVILESIWSEIDINHLCSENCRGLCPVCGKNLNEGSCNCNN